MNIRCLFIVFAVSFCGLILRAQSPAENEPADSVKNIIEEINAGGVIDIILPGELESRMRSDSKAHYEEEKKSGKYVDPSTRYTIQIFSENKGQSSKKTAEYRKRVIEQRMPGTHASVVYDSPYWRVRVGAYKTEEEVRVAERNIRQKFPTFSSDLRIIRYKAK